MVWPFLVPWCLCGEIMRKGHLFIISAPSGTGKSTVVGELLKKYPDFYYSVSYTTRKPREEEKDGVDYRFIDQEAFEKLIQEDFFAEWAKVHSALYGTPKKEISNALEAGRSVIFDIDVQGGMNLKKHFPEAVTIFLTPPSFEELEKRLEGRKTDSPQSITKRLADSKKEMAYKDKYDYSVINDEVPRAVLELSRIISSYKKD